MTDKQIIAKDVDTSACKFFRNNICASPINSNCKLCDELSEKMCYYKQLKRKEQECEQLKAELELFKTSNQTTIDQLKAENEELTSKCSLLKLENIKQGNKILALKSKRLNMFEHLDIVQKNIEYEEFLKYLKVTAERARKYLFATKSEDYSDGMKWLGCLLWNRIEELEEKLQKINEVEDVNNNR